MIDRLLFLSSATSGFYINVNGTGNFYL